MKLDIARPPFRRRLELAVGSSKKFASEEPTSSSEREFAAPEGSPGAAGAGAADPDDEEEEDDDEFAGVGGDEVETVVADSGGGSGGRSSVFKGMLWSGLGVALIGGGVTISLLSVAGAHELHTRSLGYSRYDEFYDQYERDTLIGYGVAGIGAATLVVGGLYLFGDRGLSRGGKGWLLTSLGVVAGGVGGYLILDSVAQGDAANALPVNDKNYTPNFDGAERTWWTGVAAASVGGAVAAVGLYLAMSKGSSSAGAHQGDPSPWRHVAFLPSVGPDSTGAALHLRW